MKTLELKQIRIDGGTQPRVEMNQDVIAEYTELLRNDTTFPPVTVFFDGVAYWLADGFHRYHAHRTAGRDSIAVDIQEGGLREAILYSVGANTEHGLRRTNEDKRKSVETMLTNDIVSKDDNGDPWSNREIARRCHVSEITVRRFLESHTATMSQYKNGNRTFTHPKTGKPATMNTANIGKSGKKRKKQYGGIAPNAFKPVRSARPTLAQTALELPHDPHYAARSLVDAMGREFSVKLIDALTTYLKGL